MNNNNYYYSFSMLHQTLAVSSPSCSSFPLKLSSSTVSPLRSSQVEEETSMEALKSSSRPKQQQQQGAFDEEVAWAVESGNLPWWEEFSVDDLLNLEFVENEKEADGEVAAFVEHQETDEPNSASYAISSSLSFEPPPPPPLVSGINLPAHDAKEFEWVSIIMDDSLSEFPSCAGVASLPSAPQSQDETGCRTENSATKSPSFVSPTVCILSTEAMVPVKAKRSKRSRSAAAAWSKSGPLPFAESSSDSSSVSSCSSTTMPSYLVHNHPSATGDPGSLLCDRPPPAKRQKLKKRGRKPKSPSSSATDVPGERRCTHCGAQKTPQWRAGPLGAKTLCNACGVRFKSGRLLPEYRPACSPTFVSRIHSNCHRKVLQMRQEKEAGLPSAAVAPPVPSF